MAEVSEGIVAIYVNEESVELVVCDAAKIRVTLKGDRQITIPYNQANWEAMSELLSNRGQVVPLTHGSKATEVLTSWPLS